VIYEHLREIQYLQLQYGLIEGTSANGLLSTAGNWSVEVLSVVKTDEK